MFSNLDLLTSQIRDNERIWNGFRQIELRLIGAQTIDGLMVALIEELPRFFPNVCRVTVACFERNREMERYWDPVHVTKDTTALAFLPASRAKFESLFGTPWRPYLGSVDESVASILFPGSTNDLKSCALAPLVLRGELIGCLNQASRRADHFQQGSGTEFLEHLAAVTAMCIDNAVIHERLRMEGLTDPLTGLYNRRFFDRRLHEELERLSRHPGNALVGMLVDVDHFKQINDTFGHEAGDHILQSVADILGQELRGSDVLARIGGEEFALLLPETDIEQGAVIAERLRERIECAKWPLAGAGHLQVTVSVGLACLGGGDSYQPSNGGSEFYRAIDAALYQAKNGGRNRVIVG